MTPVQHCLLGAVLGCTAALAQSTLSSPLEFNQMQFKVAAKAAPDECFYGFNDPRNYPDVLVGNTTPTQVLPSTGCPGGKYKTNQSYVWGLSLVQNRAWFGTVANTVCNVAGPLAVQAGIPLPGLDLGSIICENSGPTPPIDPAISGSTNIPIGDWRPPMIYSYNVSSRQLLDRTALPASDLRRLRRTFGLRAAFNHNGVVFVAGTEAFGVLGGTRLNMFTYRADTGAFIASMTLAEYSDVRFSKVVNGELYVAVLSANGIDGQVLRWVGNASDPFSGPGSANGFLTVGKIAGGYPAYIGFHENRIVVNTWGNRLFSNTADISALYISPVLTPGGRLEPADAAHWVRLFDYSWYEREPAALVTTFGGAIESYNGWLYFSTMSVPGLGALAAQRLYGLDAADPLQLGGAFLGTVRASSVYRIRNLGTSNEIELLYGERFLPAFDRTARQWTVRPTGRSAKWGPAGFGNLFNTYVWTSGKVGGKLLFGTFDWRLLFGLPQIALPESYRSAYESLQSSFQGVAGRIDLSALSARMKAAIQQSDGFPADVIAQISSLYAPLAANGILDPASPLRAVSPISVVMTLLNSPGADLWVFPSEDSAAYPENVSGLGNIYNYGLRNIEPTPSGTNAYFGMANAYNTTPKGGWELILGSPAGSPPLPASR